MKNNRLNYYLSILIIFMIFVITACKKECTTKDTIVENKLTPEVLTFFRYDSFDTIQCSIKNQQNITIQSEEITEGTNTYKEIENLDCGTGIIYKNATRTIQYFDNNKLILSTKLSLTSSNTIVIDFNFYNSLLLSSYSIGFSTFEKPDTMTINGYFYNDVFVSKDNQLNEELFYSKSFGLVKAIENGNIVFQLIR